MVFGPEWLLGPSPYLLAIAVGSFWPELELAAGRNMTFELADLAIACIDSRYRIL